MASERSSEFRIPKSQTRYFWLITHVLEFIYMFMNKVQFLQIENYFLYFDYKLRIFLSCSVTVPPL